MEAKMATSSDYNEFKRIYDAYTKRCVMRGERAEVYDEAKFAEYADGGILLAIDEMGESHGFAFIGAVSDSEIRVFEIFGDGPDNLAEKMMVDFLKEVGKAEGFKRLTYWNMELTTDKDSYWRRLGFESVNATDEFELVI